MKGIAAISLLLIVSGYCQKPQEAANRWSFAGGIGLAILKDGKTCLSIDNASLQPHTRLRLVITLPSQKEPSQKKLDAHVIKADASCPESIVGLQRYKVRLDTGKLDAMPAIAVVGFSGKFNRRDDLIRADLDGDGQDEFFRSCASSEGIHFTVWSAKPLGRLRWHEYYYLGYDLEPTCTEAETAPPK